MSNVLRFLFFAVFFFNLSRAGAQLASAYALVDHTTGYALESYKGDEKRAVASLTKIATAKVVLDWAAKTGLDLSQQAVVPPDAITEAGGINPMGLQPNDSMSYRDLIYAAMMQSDNTAATTLAYYVGAAFRSRGGEQMGDLTPIEAFASQMNALARSIGMEKTLFVNPHGLEPRKGLQPYSDAIDMAKLADYAMKDPAFRFYVSQRERKVSYTRNGQTFQYLLRNTNDLVGTKGIDGVKTGRTAKAGECIIISAQRDPEITKQGDTTLVTPRRVTVVVLGAINRESAADQLLTRAWSLYDQWSAAGRPRTTLSLH
jgi:serine-type D-Ala-D-Ala carboxypeptidase (penicillin-binding protein 5/6)